jgi:zinc protease
MMGRIGASVREELGLAYYAYSQIDGGMGPGPWSIAAGVNPANVGLAIERIIDELRRLTSEPVSDQDLSDNQAYYVGHLPLQLESNEGIAGTLHNMELYHLGLDYLITYRDQICSLTKEDLLAAARHYLNPNALVIGVAGPAT